METYFSYRCFAFPLAIAPYSLGKLIEWKLEDEDVMEEKEPSLLVREINWMETVIIPNIPMPSTPGSLLVREINWMETGTYKSIYTVSAEPLLPTR